MLDSPVGSCGAREGLTPANTANTASLPPSGYIVTADGLRRVGDPRIATDAPPSQGEIEASIAYLSRNWVSSKSATQGSYGLKHEAEAHAPSGPHQGYVSNGALIRAALVLGLRVELDRHSPINAAIYVKRPPHWAGPFCERDGCRGAP